MSKIIIHNASLDNRVKLVSEYTDNMNVRIEAEQIRHIYSQTPLYVPMVFAGSLLSMIMLWPATSAVIAISWCVLIWGIYLGLWQLSRRWKQAQPDDLSMHAWARPYVVMAWLATAAWGMAGVLFFHESSFVYQSLLFIILVIGAAAVTVTSTAYSPTFYPVLLLILPLFLRLLFEDDILYYLLAAGIFLFTVMLFFLHRNSHGFYESSLRQQFMNEMLAAELAMQKDIAEQANVSKSKFLAAVSHDLRQPLQALSLFMGELRLPGNSEGNRKKLIENMDKSINGMHDLFNGVLDVSRFESGVVIPAIKTFCIDDLLAGFKNEYSIRARSEGLRFSCVSCSENIVSDPILLRRIVRNLLENALRYTRKGKIVLGCRKRSGYICLQVWDTGVGIAAENLVRIFDEFQQLENPVVKAKGIGLGLTVVKQLAGVLGHEVQVESVPGKGTVFSLMIALADTQNFSLENSDQAAFIEDNLKYSTVVLLDDENNSDGLGKLLTSWGCKVYSASDTDTMQKILQNKSIRADILICNIAMDDPLNIINDKSGLTGNTDISIIVLTNDITQNCLDISDKTGTKFLSRPLNPVRLATLMRFVLTERA